MREIGTIAEERHARALADHLLTLGITTRLDPRPGAGFAVWVHREDRLDEARAALAEFRSNPDDPRFAGSARQAKAIRKDKDRAEAEHRRMSRRVADRWEGAMHRRAPLAFGLIAAGAAVSLAQIFYPPTYLWLAFSIEYIGPDGLPAETGYGLIRAGQAWRLVTPIFLHFGLFHILFNIAAIRFLGEPIEMRKGSWRLGLLVLVAAVAGNVAQFAYNGGAFGGLSGVAFALAGYLWAKGQADPGDGLALGNRAFQNMMIWFAVGFLAPALMPGATGFPFNMANVVHAGGLAVGLLFGLLKF